MPIVLKMSKMGIFWQNYAILTHDNSAKLDQSYCYTSHMCVATQKYQKEPATHSLLRIDHRLFVLVVLKLAKMGVFWHNYAILTDDDGARLDQLYIFTTFM